jgi:hypothetical protein
MTNMNMDVIKRSRKDVHGPIDERLRLNVLCVREPFDYLQQAKLLANVVKLFFYFPFTSIFRVRDL